MAAAQESLSSEHADKITRLESSLQKLHSLEFEFAQMRHKGPSRMSSPELPADISSSIKDSSTKLGLLQMQLERKSTMNSLRKGRQISVPKLRPD